LLVALKFLMHKSKLTSSTTTWELT
jgi:hypothetical protein